jgi:hypothetical protein
MKKVLVTGRLKEERGFEKYVTEAGKEMRMPVIKGYTREEFDTPVAGTLFNPVAEGTFKEKVYLVMGELHGMMLVPEKWIIE